MAPRAKKPTIPVSEFHPIKLWCLICGAQPYTFCRPVNGHEFTSSVEWCHKERYLQYELEAAFE